VLSFVMSFVGSYTAVSLSEQFRVSTKLKTHCLKHNYYLVMMAFSIGGGAVWCMHFIGMSAVRLSVNGDVIPMHYDVGVTILSLICAIVFVYIGLYVATLDRMYTKSEQEIVAILSECASTQNIAALQNPYFLWKLAILHGTQRIWQGGVISGGGICTMHYIGMMAMVGPFYMHWNWGLVVLSVIIACGTASTAYWILFRLLALYPRKDHLRFVSAAIFAIAVCGTHYSGTAAATFEYPDHGNPKKNLTGTTVDHDVALLAAVIGGLAFNWIMTAVTLSELRKWHYSLSSSLKVERDKVATMSRDPDYLLRRSINCSQHNFSNDKEKEKDNKIVSASNRVFPTNDDSYDDDIENGSYQGGVFRRELGEVDSDEDKEDSY
jgi:diguanylate cyclase